MRSKRNVVRTYETPTRYSHIRLRLFHSVLKVFSIAKCLRWRSNKEQVGKMKAATDNYHFLWFKVGALDSLMLQIHNSGENSPPHMAFTWSLCELFQLFHCQAELNFSCCGFCSTPQTKRSWKSWLPSLACLGLMWRKLLSLYYALPQQSSATKSCPGVKWGLHKMVHVWELTRGACLFALGCLANWFH